MTFLEARRIFDEEGDQSSTEISLNFYTTRRRGPSNLARKGFQPAISARLCRQANCRALLRTYSI